ncbi:Oligopeptide transport system permease protein OppB [Methanosarcina lacustris Z-7289]|uniref:Nickel import system ATP-binding protein NikD n=1 Tax=Methanosarcina lacustris Z-7289 TaxID=1434111 RepID=A0A0E3S109_9EURY|nr:ABC transporter ATP-binding protein [Methanosarcina lacustris]AKB73676.1 Oligopeptide transport system permease protein OppB [Methanosarcina lacustris Z-7289]
MNALLEVKDLNVSFQGNENEKRKEKESVTAVFYVSFSIREKETLALVGETGCGKSVVAHAIMRLLPPESRVKGTIEFGGKNLLELSEKEMAKLRGKEISIIFQNPSLALNPVYSIGHQLAEPLRIHGQEKRKGKEWKEEKEIKEKGWKEKEEKNEKGLKMRKNNFSKVARVLKRMGFSNPHEYMGYYPSWCSGGMNQRFLIAASTMLDPVLLIADEPSKGLDRNRVAELEIELKRLKEKSETAILLISHDLGFVRRLADRVAVMYAGEIVEITDPSSLFERPLHPYTRALLNSLPERGFVPIPGSSPPLSSPPEGCRFHPRCPFKEKLCMQEHPELKESNGRAVRCFLCL